MSLTAGRTWEYPAVAPRKGDAFAVVQRWPDWFMASFAIYLFPPGTSTRMVGRIRDVAGLLDDDSERCVIDLSGNGLQGALSIRFGTAMEDDQSVPVPLGTEPTFSVAAFSWSETEHPRESFGLWSANMIAPAIPIERDLAPTEYFVGAPRTLPGLTDNQISG